MNTVQVQHDERVQRGRDWIIAPVAGTMPELDAHTEGLQGNPLEVCTLPFLSSC